MTYNSLIDEIKRKDLDIQRLAKRIIDNKGYRNEVVNYLMFNKNIMVYYHSYYVLSRASEIKPQLFYEYWNDFVELLGNKNSYKRDIGMILIANLITVDGERKFDNIFDKYIEHINDEKFMTAQCCVRNLKKIIQQRKDLIDNIVSILLKIQDTTSYPKKQKELLKYDILDIFKIVYDKAQDKDEIKLFIKNCLESISPKTKKMAKEIFKNFE